MSDRRTFHFVACIDDGIPVAICLEHDLVVLTETADGLRSACARVMAEVGEAARSEGLDPWDRPPPAAGAVAEIRDATGSFEFAIDWPVESAVHEFECASRLPGGECSCPAEALRRFAEAVADKVSDPECEEPDLPESASRWVLYHVVRKSLREAEELGAPSEVIARHHRYLERLAASLSEDR